MRRRVAIFHRCISSISEQHATVFTMLLDTLCPLYLCCEKLLGTFVCRSRSKRRRPCWLIRSDVSRRGRRDSFERRDLVRGRRRLTSSPVSDSQNQRNRHQGNRRHRKSEARDRKQAGEPFREIGFWFRDGFAILRDARRNPIPNRRRDLQVAIVALI